MKLNRILFLTTAISIASIGCVKKEGCTDSNALNYDEKATSDDGSCAYQIDNLQLSFHHKAGNQDMIYGTEYTLSTGRKIKFNVAQFYMSGFSVDGSSVNKNYDTHLLITAEDDSVHAIGQLTGSNITGLTMAIGVDESQNNLDPATFDTDNALSANQPNFAHWAWDSGYKFLVMEGIMDSTAAMNGPIDYPFVYHLGFNDAYESFVVATNFSTDGSPHIIDLNVDWLQFFNDVNLPEENSAHMFSASQFELGERILAEGPNAITLQ